MREVSTLDQEMLYSGLFRGNTKGQIQFAIKELFAGSKVKFLHHIGRGKIKEKNEELIQSTMLRLKIEHGIELHQMIIDKENCTMFIDENAKPVNSAHGYTEGAEL